MLQPMTKVSIHLIFNVNLSDNSQSLITKSLRELPARIVVIKLQINAHKYFKTRVLS
jgi:hypothetical protein